MDEDESHELEELLELILTFRVIDGPTLGRLARGFAYLGSRIQAEFRRAVDEVIPGQDEFERSILDVQREIRTLAQSHGIPLPRSPAERSDDVASVRIVRSVGAVVEALAYLSMRPELQ